MRILPLFPGQVRQRVASSPGKNRLRKAQVGGNILDTWASRMRKALDESNGKEVEARFESASPGPPWRVAGGLGVVWAVL